MDCSCSGRGGNKLSALHWHSCNSSTKLCIHAGKSSLELVRLFTSKLPTLFALSRVGRFGEGYQHKQAQVDTSTEVLPTSRWDMFRNVIRDTSEFASDVIARHPQPEPARSHSKQHPPSVPRVHIQRQGPATSWSDLVNISPLDNQSKFASAGGCPVK